MPKLNVRIEGIQLCVANAERLMRDAHAPVSPETRLALHVQGLEEIAKAWLLYFHHHFDAAEAGGDTPTSRFIKAFVGQFDDSDLRQAEMESFDRFVEENRERFSTPAIERAFQDHEAKLEFIGFFGEFMDRLLRLLDTNPKLASRVIYPSASSMTKGSARTPPKSLRQEFTILDRLNLKNLAFLDRVRVEATYVGITSGKNKALFSPGLDLGLEPQLHEMFSLLTVTLKGQLNQILRAESRDLERRQV